MAADDQPEPGELDMPVRLIALTTAALLLSTPAAHAYIGPGAGAGTIAVVLGILAAIGMAFVAIIWYPLKRLFKKRKAAADSDTGQSDPS